jgi:hypothetical protein
MNSLSDRKLLSEPVEASTEKSGKCQPLFLFLIRDLSLPVKGVILEVDVTVRRKVGFRLCT